MALARTHTLPAVGRDEGLADIRAVACFHAFLGDGHIVFYLAA
jgi:hypothetical protein